MSPARFRVVRRWLSNLMGRGRTPYFSLVAFPGFSSILQLSSAPSRQGSEWVYILDQQIQDSSRSCGLTFALRNAPATRVPVRFSRALGQTRKHLMRFIDREEVAERLTYDICIPIVRHAMIAFSRGETKQLLRSILPLSDGRLFGVMPGAMGVHAPFGAKLISVFPENFARGVQSHQGLVILFDPETGAPVCVLHAGEITAIRTAAASAVATDARALGKVRDVESIVVWGRSPERVRVFAERMQAELALPVTIAGDVKEAVAQADIVCTVSSAAEPILKGEWVRPGTHLNLVGSSYAGPAEVDSDLVVRSRFIADSREGVLNQGAEFLRAKAAGLIGDEHIVAEIGQVLAGEIEGRRSAEEITVYKSLGHIVQDLASAWALYSESEKPL